MEFNRKYLTFLFVMLLCSIYSEQKGTKRHREISHLQKIKDKKRASFIYLYEKVKCFKSMLFWKDLLNQEIINVKN